MNNFGKNLALWVIIGLLLIALFNLFQGPTRGSSSNMLAYSEFIQQVNSGAVRDVTIKGNTISGHLNDNGKPFTTQKPGEDPSLITRLIDKNVRVTAAPEDEGMHPLLSMLISWFPLLLIIGLWVFFMRQMQSGSGRAMGFGKSRAKLLTEKVGRVTFEDVAGVDEAKQEVEEIIEFLRDPQKFQRLGGKIPKGVLLVGPPGTGKTLLARAIAGEAEVPFFSISGSDFVEMFVGVGASRVRDMFDQAKKQAPCIVFIDEIDAMGRHRGAGIGGGNDEREQTLNQLLVEMDGFESNEGVILVAATNRPDVLDPALLRPGRFDRQVVVPTPDIGGREQILKVHMRKVPLSADVEVKMLARGTPGFSGADLANLVNEAALNAARLGRDKVSKADFETAKDKVMMGAERRSMILSDEQKRTTAYHEAGHTLVAKNLKHADPVHKVSIIPRGRALGVTMQLPLEDRFNHDREYLEDQISIMMGGRLGEELVLKQMTTGASNDFERATKLARNMVTMWGMSESMGPMVYGERDEEIFLGREVTRHQNVSEDTARAIDGEVRRLIDTNYARAKKILTDHMDQLHYLAEALIEYETLEDDEIDQVMAGKKLHREVPPEKPHAPPPSPSATAPTTPVEVKGKEAGQES